VVSKWLPYGGIKLVTLRWYKNSYRTVISQSFKPRLTRFDFGPCRIDRQTKHLTAKPNELYRRQPTTHFVQLVYLFTTGFHYLCDNNL
jgi:hypothetical protein